MCSSSLAHLHRERVLLGVFDQVQYTLLPLWGTYPSPSPGPFQVPQIPTPVPARTDRADRRAAGDFASVLFSVVEGRASTVSSALTLGDVNLALTKIHNAPDATVGWGCRGWG